MNQPPQTTAVQDIENEAMQIAGLNAIPIPDDYYRDETELAGGGIIAFADGGVPSMDPGMPYGLGYTNGMGYAEGGRVGGIQYADGSVGYAIPGLVALGNVAARAMPYVSRGLGNIRSAMGGLPLGGGGADKAILGTVGAAGRGALNLGKAAKANPLTTAGVLGAGYGYVAGEGEPAGGPAGAGDEKSHEADGNNAAKAQPKVSVEKKTEDKIKKAEDSYEQYLRKMLKDSEMAESDKNEAIGFALMKAGAKAMAGKSQYAMQNIGEAVEAGADEYIRNLSQAKKDKKEAMKTLAEYGLAKEKLGIEREKAIAAREGVAEQAATRKEIAQANLRQKYYDAYQDAYKYIPQFKPDGSVNPQWKSFSQFMSEAQASRGPDTSKATPIGERQPLSSDRYR